MLTLAWAAYGALLGLAAAAIHATGWWRRRPDPPATFPWWLPMATTALAAGLGAADLRPTLQLVWALALVPAALMLPVEAAVRRIPNKINGTYAAIAVAALVATAVEGATSSVMIALVAAAVAAIIYTAGAHLRAGIGLGDVKAAPSLAAVTALDGGSVAVWAFVIAQLATLVHALLAAARARTGRATRVAHGPWMIAGAVAAILAHHLR